MMVKRTNIDATIEFLNLIGIATSRVDKAEGFLSGVRIEEGNLLVDPTCHVSDLLHEAGHVAIFPSRYRRLMTGNIEKAQRLMLDDVWSQNLHPDDPLSRAAMQSSDVEATAWAWAAGVHLSIEPCEIIMSRSTHYEGNGPIIRTMLSMGQYAGIHGLAHAGFCAVNKRVSAHSGKPLYPELAMWKQY